MFGEITIEIMLLMMLYAVGSTLWEQRWRLWLAFKQRMGQSVTAWIPQQSNKQ